LRGDDADGVGAAGTDGAAGDGLERFAHADFDRGEVVVAAAEGEAVAGEGRVGPGEEADDLAGRHGDLAVEGGQLGWDGYGLDGLAGRGEEGIRREAGAGAVGLPLVAEEARVWVEVAEGGGVSWAGSVGAVLGEWAGGVLGPEAVEDEGGVLGALSGVGVRVAELWGPGEVEEVIVEGLGGGGFEGKCSRARTWDGFGCGLGVRVTGREREKKAEEDGDGSLLHAGRISGPLLVGAKGPIGDLS
jgi:hypothetical protein